jgi:hypothetical protein
MIAATATGKNAFHGLSRLRRRLERYQHTPTAKYNTLPHQSVRQFTLIRLTFDDAGGQIGTGAAIGLRGVGRQEHAQSSWAHAEAAWHEVSRINCDGAKVDLFVEALTQLAQSALLLASRFVAAPESNQGVGCLCGPDLGCSGDLGYFRQAASQI